MFRCYHFKHIMLSSILALNEKNIQDILNKELFVQCFLSSSVICYIFFGGVKAEYWLVSVVGMVT